MILSPSLNPLLNLKVTGVGWGRFPGGGTTLKNSSAKKVSARTSRQDVQDLAFTSYSQATQAKRHAHAHAHPFPPVGPCFVQKALVETFTRAQRSRCMQPCFRGGFFLMGRGEQDAGPLQTSRVSHLCVLLGLHYSDQRVKDLECVGRLLILALGITVPLPSSS